MLYAGIHQKVFGYHRLLSKRFPYAVYYTLEQDLIVIRRILDLRQNPRKIRKALK
jgi:plasmid stabilization system protein ParE